MENSRSFSEIEKKGLSRKDSCGNHQGNWSATASEGRARPSNPRSRRNIMKKIVYSLAVMLRVARADKLSAPYRYY
jgi:hypothetical protein